VCIWLYLVGFDLLGLAMEGGLADRFEVGWKKAIIEAIVVLGQGGGQRVSYRLSWSAYMGTGQ